LSHDEPVPPPTDAWMTFRRSDASAVINLVRRVAAAGDPGLHGHGVEVVLEAPRQRWYQALFNHDEELAQARIVVTRAGGRVGYPFDIQLVTAYGGDAAHRIGPSPGWSVSNSNGLAFLIQKGRPGLPPNFGHLVGAAVSALAALRHDPPPDTGWRFRRDRAILRT
jgi:hypothetical protein